MREAGHNHESAETNSREAALSVLREGIHEIAEIFSEEETGDRLMQELEGKLPDQIDQNGLITTLETMKDAAIKDRSPKAGLLLNLITYVKTHRS